jgi:hypothetical protein
MKIEAGDAPAGAFSDLAIERDEKSGTAVALDHA